jgi:hypothetical protein
VTLKPLSIASLQTHPPQLEQLHSEALSTCDTAIAEAPRY